MHDKNLFSKRRKELLQKLSESSIAIFSAATVKYRNSDAEYLFRQNSNFYYLTGYPEADAVLVLFNGMEILFNLPREPEKELWTGTRIGQKIARQDYLFQEAYALEELGEKLSGWIKTTKNIYFSEVEQKHPNLAELLAKITKFKDTNSLLAEMRLLKSESEIANMRKAAEISCQAHKHLMALTYPDMNESELEAEFQYYCHKHGARNQAYIPIVAGGKNSCTLHYNTNNKQLRSGDLVLVDAGCEFEHYASDITRTFPVGKKFTEEQGQIYSIVLAAQEAGINQVKPGNKFSAIQDAILDVIVNGLLELRLLSGSKKQIIKNREYTRFYMHSSGHWLGLDVHDLGTYKEKNGNIIKLKPGMVLTVEPGIYISPDDESVSKKWRGIGIRIEDDIVVTENGCDNLTAGVPKTISAIEKLRM